MTSDGEVIFYSSLLGPCVFYYFILRLILCPYLYYLPTKTTSTTTDNFNFARRRRRLFLFLISLVFLYNPSSISAALAAGAEANGLFTVISVAAGSVVACLLSFSSGSLSS